MRGVGKNDNGSKDNSFFMIVDKAPIERVEDMTGRFGCFLRLFCFLRINIQSTAYYVIKSKVFETLSLIVIIANSISLALYDPTLNYTPYYQSILDDIFLVLYSIEMVFKILGLGFVFNKGAYLRDSWNVLDFFIIMVGYVQIVFSGASFNLSGLRSFRVLRPLRSIQRIEGLKIIVTSMLGSLKLLRDTMIVLFFFYLIFAIAGL